MVLTAASSSSSLRADPRWLRVDHRADHVDQRIEDEQDPCADHHGSRQGMRRRRGYGGPGDGDGASDEEEAHLDSRC